MNHIKIKLNGGTPIVLCSSCDKIIRKATSGEAINPTVFQSEYCDECLKKIVDRSNEYKHWT